MNPLSADLQATVDLELQLVDRLRAALEEARAARKGPLPDPRVPCFAHLRVQTSGRQRDLLLGFQTLILPRQQLTLLDWRSAPLAAVFFGYEQGEAYDEEVDGRSLNGVVVQKRLLAFTDGELRQIITPEAILCRERDGRWRAELAAWLPALASAASSPAPIPVYPLAQGPLGHKLPAVSALLDSQQQALLEKDPRQPLLILGGAGSGKTTVALHRLARLHQRDPRRFGQKKQLVVVPEPGLARLSSLLLERLGLPQVTVLTFDAWVTRQARAVLRDLPRKLASDTPARVIKLKRHPALLAALPRLLEQLTAATAQRLDRALAGRGRLAAAFLATPGATLLQRLERFAQATRAEATLPEALLRQTLQAERRRIYQVHQDLLELFGEQELLQAVAARSDGELGAGAVAEVLEHTRLQFSETAEQTWAHVDQERLKTADGRALDAGTPLELAGRADVEDYAVGLEILRLKTGAMRSPTGRLQQVAHLVLDEVQELAPIELGVLGQALGQGGSITLCGDQAQQIDPTTCFIGWQQVLAALGCAATQPVQLKTSYRCPAPVTAFAHQLLGPLAPAEMPRAVRDGAPVQLTELPTEGHLAYALCQALDALLAQDPSATVAIISRNPAAAQRTHAALERSLPLRLVRDGNFSFTPGIDVTDVAEVKGLEFDVVILPDVTPQSYPDEPEARRLLHVACTRAIYQLWLLWVGRPSPLLPGDH